LSTARPSRRRGDERSLETGGQNPLAAPPADGSFMTLLRRRLKSRRPTKKLLAFEVDSHK
jgi:hypothetical protein